eukprot:scpid70766/ scgid24097/ 
MKLCEWIEISVLTQSNSATDMTEVCKRYCRFLDELGLIGHVQRSLAMKQRLMEHVCDRLQFHRPVSRREPELWKKALDDLSGMALTQLQAAFQCCIHQRLGWDLGLSPTLLTVRAWTVD